MKSSYDYKNKNINEKSNIGFPFAHFFNIQLNRWILRWIQTSDSAFW